MFEQVLAALEDIDVRARRQSDPLSTWHMGMPFTVVADCQAHGPLATLYIINAVSALDDALKFVMKAGATTAELEKGVRLGNELNFSKNAMF